jgi:hypothetical protein
VSRSYLEDEAPQLWPIFETIVRFMRISSHALVEEVSIYIFRPFRKLSARTSIVSNPASDHVEDFRYK